MNRTSISRPLPIVQSIPHGGLAVPPVVQDDLAIDDVTIVNECDLWADEIYNFNHPDLADLRADQGSGTLAAVNMEIARVLIDANRPPDSLDHPDGAVKTQTSYGDPIYRVEIGDDLQRQLLHDYWQPYHDQLDATLRRQAQNVRLFLDCHNMAQEGPTAYGDPGQARPFICVANNGDSRGDPVEANGPITAPADFTRRAAAIAQDLFCDLDLLEPNPQKPAPIVGINEPFVGGYILRHYTSVDYQRSLGLSEDKQYVGLMVEINRGLFVGNQTTRSPIQPPNQERIAAVRRRLYQWIRALVDLLSRKALL